MFVVLAVLAVAVPSGPQAGDKAPPLTPEKLLQAPADAAPGDLTGSAIVLEFWGTWCGPCLAAIPHLNELADSFKDHPVRFIAATDQAEDKVAPLLKRRPMNAWIALDTDRSMFASYGVEALPHTVLIDRTGIVRAITTPLAVSRESIEDLLAGRKIRLRTPEDQTAERRRLEQGPPLKPIVQTLIRPAQANVGLSSTAPGRLELLGKPLTSSIVFLTGVPHDRIDGAHLLPDDPYDVVVTLPPEQDDRVPTALREMLDTAFGVRVRTERRDAEVWVLTRLPGASPAGLTPADPGGAQSSSAGSGRLNAVGCPLGHVTGHAQRELGGLVVDETGPGVFDYVFEYTPGDRDGFIRALRDQMGLGVERAARSVTFAVVEKPGA